jgi:radical SAM superfamily enzyme YgiQ (UPF0313 family)
MPKVLLIQPTQYAGDGTLCKQRRIFLPGLALPLLAALTPSHWQVEIALEVVDEINFDTDADLVGIGSMGHAAYRGIHLADEFRRRGKTVVMGGYMASLMPQVAIQHVDAVIIGDAEISYPQLLADFERTGRVQTIYDTPVTSLVGLPVPRYELLMHKPLGGMLPAQAGRGCPHHCSFCAIACIYRGRYLTRPVAEVVRDILAIKALGLRQFVLLDDNLVSNPRFLQDLCDAIEPLGMTWATQCSLELARKPDLLRRVRKAGATMMSFGVESVEQDGVDTLGKGWLKVDQHAAALQTISRAGILVSTEMMVGTDADTEATFAATARFVEANRIPIPRFYVLTPTPGTPFHAQVKEEGRLLTDDFQYYTGAYCVHRPAKLAPEQVNALYWQLYERVFAFGSILRRTLGHPHFWRNPLGYLFACFVNLHYRRYVKKRVPPNIL